MNNPPSFSLGLCRASPSMTAMCISHAWVRIRVDSEFQTIHRITHTLDRNCTTNRETSNALQMSVAVKVAAVFDDLKDES